METTASRQAVVGEARKLLRRWQNLNQSKQAIDAEMGDIEARLAQHIDLRRRVHIGDSVGSFGDVLLDPNDMPVSIDSWVDAAIQHAGLRAHTAH